MNFWTKKKAKSFVSDSDKIIAEIMEILERNQAVPDGSLPPTIAADALIKEVDQQLGQTEQWPPPPPPTVFNADTVNMTINNFGACCPNRPRLRLAVTGIEIEPKPTTQGPRMLTLKLRTSQKATIKLNPVDRFGKSEPLDGEAGVEVVSGDAVATVLPDNRIQIVPSDVPGKSVINVTADAQEGPDKEVISETIEVETLHDNAVSLGAVIESIEDKAPPATTPTT